jgi:hypothetical protein
MHAGFGQLRLRRALGFGNGGLAAHELVSDVI